MFCSKCGKQVADGAAFCDGCGYALSGGTPLAQSQVSPISKMTDAEKNEKMCAVLLFCISSVMDLLFWWLVVASEFKAVSFLFEGTAPSYVIESLFEKLFENCGGIMIFICVVLTIGYTVIGITSYAMPYMKRDFSSALPAVKTSNIIDSVMLILGTAAIFVIFIAELNAQPPYFLLVPVLVLAWGHICVVVTYNKAVKAEEHAIWQENQTNDEMRYNGEEKYSSKNVLSRSRLLASNNAATNKGTRTWECENCGTMNSNTDSFCKDCGNYR